MDKFNAFVTDNYIWFLVITIFLIFALIGYFYDNRKSKNEYVKQSNSINASAEEPIMVNNNISTSELENNGMPEENNTNIEMNEINNNN